MNPVFRTAAIPGNRIGKHVPMPAFMTDGQGTGRAILGLVEEGR